MALLGIDTAQLDSYTADTCARPDVQALRARVDGVQLVCAGSERDKCRAWRTTEFRKFS